MLLNLFTKHKQIDPADPHTPMPAGPIIYREDGQIDWGNMWDSFCMLALDGGPPHRGDLLTAPTNPDIERMSYHAAVIEIARGVWETTGLTAVPDTPGWIAIICHSSAQARWLAEAILKENVEARSEGHELYVPVSDQFQLKHETKNVITAVAKTSHYWDAHLAVEVKQSLAFQDGLQRLLKTLGKLFGG